MQMVGDFGVVGGIDVVGGIGVVGGIRMQCQSLGFSVAFHLAGFSFWRRETPGS